MAQTEKERTYSDQEIEQRLNCDLPHWYLEDGGSVASTDQQLERHLDG
jgi:hypothetical protein